MLLHRKHAGNIKLKPKKATAHYSSRGHLKFLKIDADSPGLPGKSSRQRLGEERRYTGTWADEIQGMVLEKRMSFSYRVTIVYYEILEIIMSFQTEFLSAETSR